MYSSAVNALTVFVFMEMELRNYDPQQKKLVQNLFALAIDRAKNDFPRPEITVAIMGIQPMLSYLTKSTGKSGD
jgi:hypothetical protein